jgi:hypothetical protein
VILPYRSCVGAATGALPLNAQRLIGDMRHFKLSSHLDCTMEVDIIVATDGSVLFGVGCHSWLIATTHEDIFMTGGELGGIATGLGVLGTLA